MEEVYSKDLDLDSSPMLKDSDLSPQMLDFTHH